MVTFCFVAFDIHFKMRIALFNTCFSLPLHIAFIESSKPTKNQLNPKIITDIVHYVGKRCKVSDTAVRSSITTKCADENKMMRQRNDKNRKTLVKINENKENLQN